MSRQRIRDERRGQPRERGQPQSQRKDGEALPDDLGVKSRAGGREEPARFDDSPEPSVEEARPRLVAERRDGAAVQPREEPAEEPLEEPARLHEDFPEVPPPEFQAQLVAEGRDGAAVDPSQEPTEQLRQELPAPRAGALTEEPTGEPAAGNAPELIGESTAVPAEEPSQEQRQAAEAAARRWFEQGLITPAQARALAHLIRDGDPSPEVLDRLVGSGILTHSQAAAIRRTQRSNGHSLVPVAGGRPAGSGAEQRYGRLGVRLARPSPDARKLGVFLAGIAFAGLVWAGVAFLTAALGTPRHPAGVALLDALRLLASVLALVGGRRMYRGMQSGKTLVMVGLVIYALASVLLAVRRLADPIVILFLLSWALLYYLTAVSRFGPAQFSPAAPGPE